MLCRIGVAATCNVDPKRKKERKKKELENVKLSFVFLCFNVQALKKSFSIIQWNLFSNRKKKIKVIIIVKINPSPGMLQYFSFLILQI